MNLLLIFLKLKSKNFPKTIFNHTANMLKILIFKYLLNHYFLLYLMKIIKIIIKKQMYKYLKN